MNMIHRATWPLLLLAGCVAWTVAVAQQVVPAPPAAPVDFAPLVNLAFSFLVPVVSVLAAWLSTKIARLLGLKSDNEIRRYIEPALQNALAYGQRQVGDLPLTYDLKNQIVAAAVNYAISQVGDGLKKLGVDEDGIARMLHARLEANVSAQTPSITATAAAPMPTSVSVQKSADPPVAG